jgi:hypothetical protein
VIDYHTIPLIKDICREAKIVIQGRRGNSDAL